MSLLIPLHIPLTYPPAPRTTNAKFDAALNVLITRDGTATQNQDYRITPFNYSGPPNIYWVSIPANEESLTIMLTPILDSDETEGDETAEFTLIGDGATYKTGGDTGAIITIADYTDLIFRDSFETP